MTISRHSKERLVERDNEINNFYKAKKIAKAAWAYGENINDFAKCPNFFTYLQTKKAQSRSCRIRVYRNNIYIWRGTNKRTLRTAYPIPKRYLEEIGGFL